MPGKEMTEGPDVVADAQDFITTDIHQAVKLRIEEDSPANYEPISVLSLLERQAREFPDVPALAVKRSGDDDWSKWTYSQYLSEVRLVAKAFIKLGLEPRGGVAILGFNSPEWFIADLAAVFANGVAAGIYQTNNAEACRYIAADCKANIAVVEDEKQLEKFLQVRSQLPDLKAIVLYRGTAKAEGVLSWSDLLDIGRKDTSDAELDARRSSTAVNRCCHLVYTSGTTGVPKGVMLSHDNLTYTARVLAELYELDGERYLSYLPLSHVAANITDIFLMITSASTVYFADRNALKGTLVDSIKACRPTLFVGVPRVWEKIYDKMQEVGRQTKGLKAQIGAWAKRLAFQRNLGIMSGSGEEERQAGLDYWLADKLVFSKVKDALGLDGCRIFFSAAAPLSGQVMEYFMSLDMRVWEIYGMSETSGPQISNSSRGQKIGKIGLTLPGFHSRLDATRDGEICMRGRNVMMGYLNSPEKTDEVFDGEGWLHSGDHGQDQGAADHRRWRERTSGTDRGRHQAGTALLEQRDGRRRPEEVLVLLAHLPGGRRPRDHGADGRPLPERAKLVSKRPRVEGRHSAGPARRRPGGGGAAGGHRPRQQARHLERAEGAEVCRPGHGLQSAGWGAGTNIQAEAAGGGEKVQRQD